MQKRLIFHVEKLSVNLSIVCVDYQYLHKMVAQALFRA
jgi:hypothetical protein